MYHRGADLCCAPSVVLFTSSMIDGRYTWKMQCARVVYSLLTGVQETALRALCCSPCSKKRRAEYACSIMKWVSGPHLSDVIAKQHHLDTIMNAPEVFYVRVRDTQHGCGASIASNFCNFGDGM